PTGRPGGGDPDPERESRAGPGDGTAWQPGRGAARHSVTPGRRDVAGVSDRRRTFHQEEGRVRHRTRLACLVLIAGTALAAAPRTPPPSPPAGPAPAARPGPFPTEEIVRILGAAGTWNQAERVYKVPFPRTDVPVSVDGWPLPPFMGLTSWVAFESAGGAQVMMMGDLVLFQDEVQDALGALLDTGAEVTALHNHFMFDDPRVFFMHVGGTGAPEKLAAAVQAAFEVVRARRAAQREPPAASGRRPVPKSALDGAGLAAALGVPGQSRDGMFKAVFGRKARHGGAEIGAEMGLNTWAGF